MEKMITAIHSTKDGSELADVLLEVANEYEFACEKFPMFNSSHEGYAVLKEEVDELWDEIKNNTDTMTMIRQRAEAVQVAAMAIKFIMSCTKKHL